MTYVVRNKSTGRYHLAIAPTVLDCNYSGQARRPTYHRPATLAEYTAARDITLCMKCFPSGRTRPECTVVDGKLVPSYQTKL